MSETVHVLLPVHNRRDLTLRFLGCLRQQTHRPLRLLLIDDGSTDGTSQAVMAEWPEATIIAGNGSWWWAGALKRAIEHLVVQQISADDIVLIANDDTEIERSHIEHAVEFLRAHPGSLLCARMQDAKTGAIKESGVHADLWRFRFRIARNAGEINCLPTRGLFLRWRDLRRIGDFHPRLLPHYWSDYEYTIRAHRRGLRCLTDASVSLRANPDSTGYHDLDHLVGRDFLRQYFSVKCPLNPVYRSSFAWLAAPLMAKVPALLIVWLRALPRMFWQGLACRPFPRRLIESGVRNLE